jgi:N6-L-threonylcarbamoyladenine synthase
MNRNIVLGIESTAHTFAVGIIDDELNIIADIRSIAPPSHTLGIDPKTVAEHHASVSLNVIERALKEGGINIEKVSAIAYSMGPGLGPALRIGATIARALAYKYNIPLYPVHHGIGHVELTCTMLKLKDPLVIIVSGGHTSILSFNYGRWRTYGETLDITLGNLFDMFARKLGIQFPGGPQIEKLAKDGNKYIEMPYNIKGNNVVYSGLLTYALNLLGKERVEDIAYSLQETAFAMLTEATERALTQLKKKEIGITGGVASNDRLYQMMTDMAKEHGVIVRRLNKKYNSDNGVQIAIVGLLYLKSDYKPTPIEKSIVRQRIRIEEVDVPWR